MSAFFCQAFRDFSVQWDNVFILCISDFGVRTKCNKLDQIFFHTSGRAVYNTASNSLLYIPSTFILHHDLEKALSSSCCLFMNLNSCFKMWTDGWFSASPPWCCLCFCENCVWSQWDSWHHRPGHPAWKPPKKVHVTVTARQTVRTITRLSFPAAGGNARSWLYFIRGVSHGFNLARSSIKYSSPARSLFARAFNNCSKINGNF